MKLSFDLDKTLYEKVTKSAEKNGRSDSGEIRFQLKKCYEGNKK